MEQCLPGMHEVLLGSNHTCMNQKDNEKTSPNERKYLQVTD